MKLNEFFKDKVLTDLSIASIEMRISESNGKKLAILTLAKPIAKVTGSQRVTDDANGESARVEAFDIDTVQIAEDDFDKEGVDLKPDGTGTIKSNELFLDVSKNSGEVWLVSTSFSAFGRAKRVDLRNERNSKLLTRINEKKATNAFKDTDVSDDAKKPEAVEAPKAKPATAVVAK